MNLVGWIVGALLQITFRWAMWKKKGHSWMEYWSEYAGLNLGSLIGTCVCYPLWEAGLFTSVIDLGYKAILRGLGTEPTNLSSVLPLSFGTSLLAAFVVDTVSRTVVLRVQAWLKKRAGEKIGPEDDPENGGGK